MPGPVFNHGPVFYNAKGQARIIPKTVNRTVVHLNAGCADKDRCHGPGCRLTTGKTARRRGD